MEHMILFSTLKILLQVVNFYLFFNSLNVIIYIIIKISKFYDQIF
jgi:hypothetical protein